MKKILLMLAVISLSICVEASSYSSHQKIKKINNGQNIFRNNLQKKCGFTASHWASQHTQSEWEDIQDDGAFKEELSAMCKRSIIEILQDKWMESLYLFAVEYAKDTNNRPRC